LGPQEADLRAEVSRVHRELVAYRDRLLPAFLGRDGAHLWGLPDGSLGHVEKIYHPLQDWQEATGRLLDALPIAPPGEAERPLQRSGYEEFLWQPASASPHVVRQGRIVWRIELFIDWNWGSDFVLSRTDEGKESGPASFGDLERRLPEVKRWLMSLPVDESLLWNALSYVVTPIADLDPAFAKLALDPETWRTIVQGDRTIDEMTRSRRLQVIDGAWFPHVLNNALLHVLAAMANNHFEVVVDFLDHPCLVGHYTRLMPHYLFAVLFEKVEVLRSLTGMAIGPDSAVLGTE
jgi:hypothetical protein